MIDTIAAESPAVETPDAAPGPLRPSAPRVLRAPALTALGTVVAVFRWWFSQDRDVFHLAPDEAGQLAMARWLSGGGRWTMFDHSTWRPGPATLIAPIDWFTDDPITIFHGGLIINAALAGIAAVVLARLVLRLTDLGPTGAILLAGVVALAPASLSASSFIWAESLVTLVFLTTLWFMLDFFEAPALRPGCLAIVAITVGFVCHSRLLPLVPVVVVLVVGTFWRRRRWWDGTIAIIVAVVAFIASYAYANMIFSAVWDDPSNNNTVETVWKRAQAPLEVADSFAAQLWSQLGITFGIFGIGMLVILRRSIRRAVVARTVEARVVVALTLPLLLVSATFMSNRSRPDHLVYARYNDAIVWPVIAIGAAWVITSLRRGRWGRVLVTAGLVVATFAGTAALTYGLHGDALAERVGVRPMIPGWLPVIGDENAIRVIRISIIALIVMVAVAIIMWLISRGGRRAVAGVVIAAALLGWAGWRTHHALALRLNSWGEAAAVVEADALIPPDTVIGFRFVSDKQDPAADWTSQRRRAQLYQMYLPHRTFVRDRGTDDSIGPYVFAPVNDPEMREADADVLWTDPTVRVALWREVIEP